MPVGECGGARVTAGGWEGGWVVWVGEGALQPTSALG